MAKLRSDTAIQLAKRWGLQVEHALYRKTGDWFHKLQKFPGALLDENGYVVFETQQAFETCSWLHIKQDVNVPNGGIKRIPGYVWVKDDAVFLPKTTSYEKELINEGARSEIILSRPERDSRLRAECILHHGLSCLVCGFNFEKFYGVIGSRFIHVHHITPLSEGEYKVNPITDMVPLCPNCHAMVHKRTPPFTVEELKVFIKESKKNKKFSVDYLWNGVRS